MSSVKPVAKGSGLEAVLGAVLPVMQVGDALPGNPGLFVAQIGVNDPIASVASPSGTDPRLAAGAHQLAFWVNASAAGNASSGPFTQFLMDANRGPNVLLNVPAMSQGAASWSTPPNAVTYDSHPVCLIKAKGCWETMLSMMHNYFAIRLGNENVASMPGAGVEEVVPYLVTPPQTNTIMVDSGAFTGGGTNYQEATTCPSMGQPTFPTDEAPDLSPADYPHLNQGATGIFGALPLSFQDDDVPAGTTTNLLIPPSSTTAQQPTDFILQSLGSNATPVGFRVTTPANHQHFILAVGVEGNRIVVADPGCSVRSYLDEQPAGCGAATAYYQNYAVRGRLVDPADTSRLIVSTTDGGTVSVTDSAGRSSGIVGGQTLTNIPQSSSFVDQSTDPDTDQVLSQNFQTVQVRQPAAGTYSVQITSVTGANFSVSILVVGANGAPSTSASIQGTGPAGQTQTFQVTIAAGAGSGSTILPAGNVVVPNVVGLAQAAASGAIAGAGLAVGTVRTANSSTVPSGSVISENPVAGTSVASGSVVNPSTVSSGPAQVSVPNVVGLTQAGASSAIIGVGLTVGTISTASSSTVPSGSVISDESDCQHERGEWFRGEPHGQLWPCASFSAQCRGFNASGCE